MSKNRLLPLMKSSFHPSTKRVTIQDPNLAIQHPIGCVEFGYWDRVRRGAYGLPT